MTPLAKGLLTVRDSQILQLLRDGSSERRVVEVGAYRRAWTADDVQRVIREHPLTGTTKRPRTPHDRTTPAARSLTPWTALTRWTPPTFDGKPVDVELTPQQAAVLHHLCRGLGNRAIGGELHVTEDTVKTHMKGVIAALQADDRLHAAVLAITGQVQVFIRHPKKRKTT